MVDDLPHAVAVVGSQASSGQVEVATTGRNMIGPDEQHGARRQQTLHLHLGEHTAHDGDAGDAVGGELAERPAFGAGIPKVVRQDH